MQKIIVIIAILVLLIPLSSSAFAKTIEINILTGSADPHVNRTFSPPSTDAAIGDVINWGNGDTVAHSITSGTPNNPDGKFDSGSLDPGKYFSYTLTDRDFGTLHFYDKTYPWMTGIINVQLSSIGTKTIKNVGSDAGDGKHTFDVQYSSIKDIISSKINPKDKSVTFTLVGKVQGNSTLVLKLPTGLVKGPLLLWVDNVQTDNFSVDYTDGMSTLTIPITPLTEQISVVGTSVIPEFGPVAEMVLVVSIIATIMLVRFKLNHRLA